MAPTLKGSTEYLLPPGLTELHQQTLDWESDLALWKQEFAIFERLINKYRKELHLKGELEELNHLRFLLNYYSYDLVNSLSSRISEDKSRLKSLMDFQEHQDESAYRTEHEALAMRILTFEQEFICFKNDLYKLLEKGLARKKRRMPEIPPKE